MDHYATLGIPRNASPEQVKRGYREKAKQYHPDRDPSPLSAERFRAAQQAYETLRDPLLRIAYDARYNPAPAKDPRYRPQPRQSHTASVEPDLKVRSFAFLGLHVTGLVFGCVLAAGLVLGVLFRNWPWGGLFFMLPGLLILPDAWRGIRLWRAGRSKMRAA